MASHQVRLSECEIRMAKSGAKGVRHKLVHYFLSFSSNTVTFSTVYTHNDNKGEYEDSTTKRKEIQSVPKTKRFTSPKSNPLYILYQGVLVYLCGFLFFF